MRKNIKVHATSTMNEYFVKAAFVTCHTKITIIIIHGSKNTKFTKNNDVRGVFETKAQSKTIKTFDLITFPFNNDA